jgi:hypothetical protein
MIVDNAFKRSGCGLMYGNIPAYALRFCGKTTETISDSNQVPPVSQSVALLLEPTCSMDTAELRKFPSLHLMTKTSTASETCLEKLKTADSLRNNCTSMPETLGLRGELECHVSEARTPEPQGMGEGRRELPYNVGHKAYATET